MQRWKPQLALLICLAAAAAPVEAAAAGQQIVDGIAARIEDDIVTESEVRELMSFQQLVDGHASARPQVVQELIDQWIVRAEAEAAKFPRPVAADVDREFERLAKQSESAEAFPARIAGLGISERAVRRLVEQQLYFARFLDYKFRPAAQVDHTQIERYYRDELVPQLAGRGQSAPALDSVEEQIRELLVQREINDRATRWLDEARSRLKIEITAGGNGS